VTPRLKSLAAPSLSPSTLLAPIHSISPSATRSRMRRPTIVLSSPILHSRWTSQLGQLILTSIYGQVPHRAQSARLLILLNSYTIIHHRRHLVGTPRYPPPISTIWLMAHTPGIL